MRRTAEHSPAPLEKRNLNAISTRWTHHWSHHGYMAHSSAVSPRDSRQRQPSDGKGRSRAVTLHAAPDKEYGVRSTEFP